MASNQASKNVGGVRSVCQEDGVPRRGLSRGYLGHVSAQQNTDIPGARGALCPWGTGGPRPARGEGSGIKITAVLYRGATSQAWPCR